MTPQNTANDVIDFTRQHLLSSVARQAEFQTAEELWEFRSQLHALHHYCTQAGLPDTLCADVENMLATSKEFWHLIDENRETLVNLKAYTKVRTLAAEAEGLTNLEELISGEDTLRDVVINGIAFLLNWKSNTIWIDSAKRARKTMTKNYMLELQDRIWQFIKESYDNTEAIDLPRVDQIRQRVDGLINLIRAGNPPVEAQVGLLMQVYGMLLRLQLGKLIIRLEALRDS
jgi:hypothetical protein